MTSTPCPAPVPLLSLVDYWFGELSAHDEERLELHLMECAQCTGRLGRLVDLGAGIRAAFRNGEVGAVISAAFLQEMQQEGLRLREYPVAPGGSVNCTIGPADDAVVSRLQVALAGATRVDLVLLNEPGAGRLPDIPFDATAGEVLFCPPAASLKLAPSHVQTIRLLAVDQSGERPIAEYTFNHSPS